MANNDEARELFQTFSLLGSSMGEGYRQASAEEEKERRKARREQLLLTLFGPAVAEGVTGLIKAPFQEPVNRFLATEGRNIRDASGKIVGYNRGGRDVKLIAKGYQDLSTTIKGVEEAAKRSGFSVYDYFQDGALTKLDDGLRDVVGEPDADVLALLDQGNRRDVAKKIAQRDYDEYVRGKALASNFPTQKATDAEIARLQLVPGNWGQGTYRLFKRLIRGESRDTVMERGIRNLEDTLGIEFTQEALDEARTIIDRASRVGDAYDIPTEIDRLIADNPKLGEQINLTRVEARNNLTRNLENASWRKSALAGTHGSAAKRFVLANKDANPIAFSDAMTEKINIPSLSKANQDLFAAIIQNDSSVQTEIEQLREHIAQYEYDMTYEDLRDGEDTTRMTRVDSFVDDSLRSIYGAAQMKSVEQITGLMDLGRTQDLERLGIFDPNSMRGQAAVLSNMRGILRHNLDTRDVETGWWLWKEINPQLTGGIDLEELMSTTFNSSNLGEAARVITEGVPSAQARSTERLDNLSRDVFEMLETESPEAIVSFINDVEPVLNEAGLRLPSNVRELRTRLEEEEIRPLVELNLSKFVTGDPNITIPNMFQTEYDVLQTNARKKLTEGIAKQWLPVGRELFVNRGNEKAKSAIKKWWGTHFEGWKVKEVDEFEKALLDQGKNILDVAQETFWNNQGKEDEEGNKEGIHIIRNLVNPHKFRSSADFKELTDWFMSNTENLALLEEVNYNLVDFASRKQTGKTLKPSTVEQPNGEVPSLFENVTSYHYDRLGIGDHSRANSIIDNFISWLVEVESSSDYSAKNKISSAAGGVQFIKNSVIPALNRLEKRAGEAAWTTALRKDMGEVTTREEFQELFIQLSPQQQHTLLMGDLLEKTFISDGAPVSGLGDKWWKKLLTSTDVEDRKEAALQIYYLGHHTNPDKATRERANKLLDRFFK